MMDCLRDNEVPQYFSSEQERINLIKDLQTFGPFRGLKGFNQLSQTSCGLGAGIDLTYAEVGNSSSSSKVNSDVDEDDDDLIIDSKP